MDVSIIKIIDFELTPISILIGLVIVISFIPILIEIIKTRKREVK